MKFLNFEVNHNDLFTEDLLRNWEETFQNNEGTITEAENSGDKLFYIRDKALNNNWRIGWVLTADGTLLQMGVSYKLFKISNDANSVKERFYLNLVEEKVEDKKEDAPVEEDKKEDTAVDEKPADTPSDTEGNKEEKPSEDVKEEEKKEEEKVDIPEDKPEDHSDDNKNKEEAPVDENKDVVAEEEFPVLHGVKIKEFHGEKKDGVAEVITDKGKIKELVEEFDVVEESEPEEYLDGKLRLYTLVDAEEQESPTDGKKEVATVIVNFFVHTQDNYIEFVNRIEIPTKIGLRRLNALVKESVDNYIKNF